MPTFDTPEPITAEIDLYVGALQINATARADTTVEVRPRDPAKDADVRAAGKVEIDYAGGRLLVKDPRGEGLGWLVSKGMFEVTVDLPAGSRVHTSTGHVSIRCEGRLGASKLKTSSGNLALDRLDGNAELTSAHGSIRAQEIDGTAVVKTTNGAITLGTVTGELRMNSAYGDITAERALASVAAKNAYGSIRISEVVRGSVDLESSYGELEVGIREGTAAWLDAGSKHGVVRSSLEAAGDPGPAEETVELRARSVHGDIIIRRS